MFEEAWQGVGIEYAESAEGSGSKRREIFPRLAGTTRDLGFLEGGNIGRTKEESGYIKYLWSARGDIING